MAMFIGCSSNQSESQEVENSSEEVITSPDEYEVGENKVESGELSIFGEELSDNNPISSDKLFTQLSEKDTVENIVISGKIAACCQKKGCWMKVDMGNDKELFVKFKDYGFFMPLDCSGSTAIMEGKAYAETISVDDLKHYAEDAGKTKEEIDAITEPETKYSFLAQGVMLTDYVPLDRTPPTDKEEATEEKEKSE